MQIGSEGLNIRQLRKEAARLGIDVGRASGDRGSRGVATTAVA